MAIAAYLTWCRNMGFPHARRTTPNEVMVFATKTREEVEQVLAPWMKVPPPGGGSLYLEFYQLVEE